MTDSEHVCRLFIRQVQDTRSRGTTRFIAIDFSSLPPRSPPVMRESGLIWETKHTTRLGICIRKMNGSKTEDNYLLWCGTMFLRFGGKYCLRKAGKRLQIIYGSLMVRVSGYRSRGPGFDSRPHQVFWEVGGLKRGLLSLVRTTEELFEWEK
jgi:hypothetical protein